MDILVKSLNLIDDIINNTDAKNISFYSKVLKIMSSLFDEASIGVYFCENQGFSLQGAVKNNQDFKADYAIDSTYTNKFFNSNDKVFELATKKDDFLYENTLFSKLAIKESVFGFCVLSINEKITQDIKTSFGALVDILSYKIKDYELNEVFKIQLKALQEAIIEKENAYEVIKKQHKKLQELDKTKNLFLANISHELRTPLNAIIGFSQALDNQIFGPLNEKQAEYIKDIQISSLHLLGMINEILDISKIEAHAMKFNPSEIDIDMVIKEVINILQPLYDNKNIQIEYNSEFCGKIMADYQKIQQILYNLLSNAIKFTGKGGKIYINSFIENKNYILKIKDTGIGIEKKNQTKIFKKFVHLNNLCDKTQNSTGLGLTITKELVKLHNGKITLESELNKGSEFTMEFKKIVVWKKY